jgi:hypothetical protein
MSDRPGTIAAVASSASHSLSIDRTSSPPIGIGCAILDSDDDQDADANSIDVLPWCFLEK